MASVSCPTRMCDENNIKSALLLLLTLGAYSYRHSGQSASAKAIWGGSNNFTLRAPEVRWKDRGACENLRQSRERESSATFQLRQCQINTQPNLVGGQKSVLNVNQGYNAISYTRGGSWWMLILRLWKTCHCKANSKFVQTRGFGRINYSLAKFALHRNNWIPLAIWQYQHKPVILLSASLFCIAICRIVQFTRWESARRNSPEKLDTFP